MTDRDIAAFYDAFRDTRMQRYRRFGNARLRAANRFVIRGLRRTDRVLEVGCGIGMTTGSLAKRVRRGHVYALDISPRNVELASQLVRRDNVTWRVVDVLADPGSLAKWVAEPVDRIVLVDVYEHIPTLQREALMAALVTVMDDTAEVRLTFPTVEYQEHLRVHDPEELQPVDEDVTAGDLEQLGAKFGFRLTFWSRRDVWLTEQYVHATLRRGTVLTPRGIRAYPKLHGFLKQLADRARPAAARVSHRARRSSGR